MQITDLNKFGYLWRQQAASGLGVKEEVIYDGGEGGRSWFMQRRPRVQG